MLPPNKTERREIKHAASGDDVDNSATKLVFEAHLGHPNTIVHPDLPVAMVISIRSPMLQVHGGRLAMLESSARQSSIHT